MCYVRDLNTLLENVTQDVLQVRFSLTVNSLLCEWEPSLDTILFPPGE